jgi:hypothetical protein
MNIIIQVDENRIGSVQPKLYDLGIITTNIQNLLDESKIVIDSYQTVVLKITDLDRNVNYYLLPIQYVGDSIFGFGKDIQSSDLIPISNGGVVSTGSTQLQQNNITFKKNNGDFFGTVTAPRTGVLTFDMTDAVTGGNAVVYYQNATLQIPSTWLTVGTFAPNVVNQIFLLKDSEGNITANILNGSTVAPPPPTIPNQPTNLTLTEIDTNVSQVLNQPTNLTLTEINA